MNVTFYGIGHVGLKRTGSRSINGFTGGGVLFAPRTSLAGMGLIILVLVLSGFMQNMLG